MSDATLASGAERVLDVEERPSPPFEVVLNHLTVPLGIHRSSKKLVSTEPWARQTIEFKHNFKGRSDPDTLP